MPGMDLDSTWREAKAGTSMTDGKSYVVEFHGPPDTKIEAVDVEGAGPPTDEEARDALAHFNRDRNPRAARPQEFKARAGWTWWLRTDGGESRLKTAVI